MSAMLHCLVGVPTFLSFTLSLLLGDNRSKKDFIKTNLLVRLLLPTDPDPTPESFERERTSPESPEEMHTGPREKTYGKRGTAGMNSFTSTVVVTRRSTRIGRQNFDRITHKVPISKTDTFSFIQDKVREHFTSSTLSH